jgi:hypothetical protein
VSSRKFRGIKLTVWKSSTSLPMSSLGSHESRYQIPKADIGRFQTLGAAESEEAR